MTARPSSGDKNTMHDSIAASAIPKEEVALDVSLPSLATERRRACPKAVGPGTVCAAMRGQEAAGPCSALARDNAIVWPPAAAPTARAGPGVGRPGRGPAGPAGPRRGLRPLPALAHSAGHTSPSRGNLARKPDFVTSPPSPLRACPPPALPGFCFPLGRSAGIRSALGLGCKVPGRPAADDRGMGKIFKGPGHAGADDRGMGKIFKVPGHAGADDRGMGKIFKGPGHTGANDRGMGKIFKVPGYTGADDRAVAKMLYPPGLAASVRTRPSLLEGPWPSSLLQEHSPRTLLAVFSSNIV